MAQDTAHTGNTPSGHTGEQEPSGPGHLMQSNAPSGHTGEQEPSGPRRRTSKATHRAGTPVNRSQVTQDTARTCIRRVAEGQEGSNTPWVGRTGATQPTHRASSRGGTPRLLVRARPGCIGVICLCLGAYIKPIFLVLHLKIKLFPMFSITIDLVGKYRTQATARRRKTRRISSWTNCLVQ